MKELLDDLNRWSSAGESVAIARVIELEGSGPRLPGAAMAVTGSGDVRGSVSGGCVESSLVHQAEQILNGEPAHIATFGFSDDDAFAVGLTCGGTLHCYVERFEPGAWFDALSDALAAQQPVALLTVVDGVGVGAKMVLVADGATVGSLGSAELDRVVARDAVGELNAGRSGIRHYGEDGQARESAVSVFIESFAAPPQLVIFGAVDFTAALARVGRVLGFRVTVCDAREVFATAQRFPMADEVVVAWPDRFLEENGSALGPRDAVCVLTHDAKFDVPALMAAFATDVGYVGAMGSRRTHLHRTERLVEAGATDTDLARLRSPIGLDLGARTPEETAISILAEIIAQRTGRHVAALRDTAGPLHD